MAAPASSSSSKSGSSSASSETYNGVLIATAIISTTGALVAASQIYKKWRARERHHQRFKFIQAEIEAQNNASSSTTDGSRAAEDEVLPSIIAHFTDFQLDYGATVEEANKKRTTKYYELTRAAHNYDLVPAVRSYLRLRNRREEELKRIYSFRGQNKSHRTVVAMADTVTAELLCEARDEILKPLNYSHHQSTQGAWIPKESIQDEQDMHVTIAIPWWWHGIRPGNQALSQELMSRFRQAVLLEFHHAFQLELERIVLLGGKVLVALWRTVGSRGAPDDFIIFDRHGEGLDPVVKLRRDIVKCFTSEESNLRIGQLPLTYSHRHFEDTTVSTPSKKKEKASGDKTTKTSFAEEPPKRPKLKRSNTIEMKSPGLGDHDGFIHTTLARLPIDCLSMNDIELEPIHRLCREATATYCGHRMVVSKFRFLETTGEGGESNPCLAPIFDEYVEAPPRVEVGSSGGIEESIDLHSEKIIDRSATIGNLPPMEKKPSMDGLFDIPPALTKSASADSPVKSDGQEALTLQDIGSAVKLKV